MLENKQEHEKLAGQMRHVEAMLDPSYSLRAISVKRRQPNPWFKRGTVYAMGTATEPLTAREIADPVLAAANVANADAQVDRISWRFCEIITARRGTGQRWQPGTLAIERGRQLSGL
jgi:hypothetical protein